MFLILSILGIPVGQIVVALYLVGLLIGVLATAFYVGDSEARFFKRPTTTYRERAVWLLAGVLSLAVLRMVPIVGGLAVFASVMFGLGALTLAIDRAYSGTSGALAA